jgi:cell division protein FtsB
MIRLNTLTRSLCRSAVIGVALFYLAFHLMHGDQGLIGRAIHQHKQFRLHEEIAKVAAERLRIEHNISLMSGDAIDADLLGELARRELPMAGEREIMIVK